MRSVLGSTAASVVSTASIVAIAGDSIAAPLAMPPIVADHAVRELDLLHRLLAHGVGGEHGVGGRGATGGVGA